MFGAGPGQLPSDAHMLGIDPMDQRRMMTESLECLIELFDGKIVNRETDWFKLRDARVQLLPYQYPRMEMSVACAITPSGPVTAGRLGLGMLSLAASSMIGFNALGDHWGVYEDAAKKAGKEVSRDSWRVVVNMHLAETREQAMADLEWGILDLIRYMKGVAGAIADNRAFARVDTAREAVKVLTSEGMGTFGVAMAGTPQDAIAHIDKLQKQSGGFGTFMFLAHNCANFEATKKSYELFARFVIPHFQRSNQNREASLDWAHANSGKIYGGLVKAMQKAIETHGEPNAAE
jgi:limonene 1,2-monooxygenase